MPGDYVQEEQLVLFFDSGHHQQVGFELSHSQRCSMRRRDLVLDHVSTFESSREVHRQEPADQVTRQSDRAPDHPQLRFAEFPWRAVQARKHLAHALAMNPFFPFDLLNCGVLVRVLYGLPVAAICEPGGKLPPVGSLENVNELSAVAQVIHSASSASVTAKGVRRELLRAFGVSYV